MDLAHVHVMIVHLPIIGTFLALIPLLWGWYKNDTSMKWIGLVILLISLIGIPIATSSGESTEHAFFRGTIQTPLDDDGAAALSIHSEAADFAAAFGYLIGLLVLIQLFMWKKEYAWKNNLFISTVILDILLVCALGYVGYLGGQIRHVEFRDTTAQSTLAEQ